MRCLLVLALSVATGAMLLAGCGSSSKASEPPPSTKVSVSAGQPESIPVASKPPQVYTRAELSRLVLQPKDAPRDLVYVKKESGPMALTDIYVLPRQIREARAYGVKGVYDAIFASRSIRSDRRVGERVWLLKGRQAAAKWLAKTKADAVRLKFTAIAAPPLGDESWAARGLIQFGGNEAITHAFRLGNAVFVISTLGQQTPVTASEALAAAKAALARAKTV